MIEATKVICNKPPPANISATQVASTDQPLVWTGRDPDHLTWAPYDTGEFPYIILSAHSPEWIDEHLTDVWHQAVYDTFRKEIYFNLDPGQYWDERAARGDLNAKLDPFNPDSIFSRDHFVGAVDRMESDMVSAGIPHDQWDATALGWLSDGWM